jgi:hypothetical protein
MKITINLDLDHEEDRIMWQRIAHIDSLCSILWRLMYGMEGERLSCVDDMERTARLMEAEGVVIEELWS